jgi:hypothetical protein
VSDRGIGMTLQTVRDYFLRVGASYRTSADWKREFADDQQASTVLRTGYFGVGALAAFLVGDEMRVRTRHVTEKEGIEFVIRLHSDPVQVNRADCPVGTTVTIPVRKELRMRWAPQCRDHLAKPTLCLDLDPGGLPNRRGAWSFSAVKGDLILHRGRRHDPRRQLVENLELPDPGEPDQRARIRDDDPLSHRAARRRSGPRQG